MVELRIPDAQNFSLAQVAIEAGHIEIVKVLVRCGADLELTMSRCLVWGRNLQNVPHVF